jgi:hypothetical protein
MNERIHKTVLKLEEIFVVKFIKENVMKHQVQLAKDDSWAELQRKTAGGTNKRARGNTEPNLLPTQSNSSESNSGGLKINVKASGMTPSAISTVSSTGGDSESFDSPFDRISKVSSKPDDLPSLVILDDINSIDLYIQYL